MSACGCGPVAIVCRSQVSQRDAVMTAPVIGKCHHEGAAPMVRSWDMGAGLLPLPTT
jgi:hypothetical protein